MITDKYGDSTSITGVAESNGEFESSRQIKRVGSVKVASRRIYFNEPLWIEDKTLALTASQFAILLRAGISVSRVIEIISDQTGDRLMKRILAECAADVRAGGSFAAGLERHSKKIPAAFIETVRAGEESGTLAMCFDRLSAHYERSHKVRQKVKAALTYPAVVLLLSIVVVGMIMVVLVPKMLQLYQNMGQELPFITRVLISVSDFFAGNWQFMLIGLAVAAISYWIYRRTSSGELIISKVKLRLPIIGKIGILNSASQFANTVSTLLTAGLTLPRVLRMTSRVMDNRAVGAEIERSADELESGRSIGDILRNSSYLPEMLIEMATIGDESGSLEETMNTVGIYYDEEAVEASDRALRMLEPIITVFLGFFVGFILLAIYLPMFNMYGGVAV